MYRYNGQKRFAFCPSQKKKECIKRTRNSFDFTPLNGFQRISSPFWMILVAVVHPQTPTMNIKHKSNDWHFVSFAMLSGSANIKKRKLEHGKDLLSLIYDWPSFVQADISTMLPVSHVSYVVFFSFVGNFYDLPIEFFISYINMHCQVSSESWCKIFNSFTIQKKIVFDEYFALLSKD